MVALGLAHKMARDRLLIGFWFPWLVLISLHVSLELLYCLCFVFCLTLQVSRVVGTGEGWPWDRLGYRAVVVLSEITAFVQCTDITMIMWRRSN